MPTYDYKCPSCGGLFDELQAFSEPPLTTCRLCGKVGVERLLGAGAGFVVRGGTNPIRKASAKSPLGPVNSFLERFEQVQSLNGKGTD